MQRILVTGGAGFIGSHTVDLLLANGFAVTVLDNLSTGKISHLNLAHPQLKFVEGDILDYPLLQQELSQCQAVLHLAALASVPKSIDDPIESLKINTQGFLHVLQAIRALKRPVRLVYASSAAVYAATTPPCSDEVPLPLQALSPYALEKANDERYADLFAHLFGVTSLGLRYFNVYGERQDPASPYSGVIARFMSALSRGESITVFGDGKQSRDFIYVGDVARANLLALQQDYAGVLNIATGTPLTLLDLIHGIEKALGKAADIQFKPARMGDVRESFAHVAKAAAQLGFHAETTLEQGIRALMTENEVS